MNKTQCILLVVFILKMCLTNNLVMGQVERWEEQLKQDPENEKILLNLGKYYHDRSGNQKHKQAVKKAEEYLTQLLHIDSTHGLALVYYGSLLTMKARDASLPWNKLKYVKKGIARMDKAVYFEPDNPEVRLIRGINSVSLPSRFNRLPCGLEDFEHIQQIHKKHPLDLTGNFWLSYYFNYGLALWKAENYTQAREKFSNAIEIDPDSDYAAAAREYVEKIEEKTGEK
ncbi:MAG: tetratricopeptide repeat protein [bacterium]